jgi:hypothetical protein
MRSNFGEGLPAKDCGIVHLDPVFQRGDNSGKASTYAKEHGKNLYGSPPPRGEHPKENQPPVS